MRIEQTSRISKVTKFIDTLKKHTTLDYSPSELSIIENSNEVRGLFGNTNFKIPYIVGESNRTRTPHILDLYDVNSVLLCGGIGGGISWELPKLLTHVAYFNPESVLVILDPYYVESLTAFGKLDNSVVEFNLNTFIPLLAKLKSFIEAAKVTTKQKEVYLVIANATYIERQLDENELEEFKQLVKYFIDVSLKDDLPVKLHLVTVINKCPSKIITQDDVKDIGFICSFDCSDATRKHLFDDVKIPQLGGRGKAVLKYKDEIYKSRLATLVSGTSDDIENAIIELLEVKKDGVERLHDLLTE